MIENQFSLDSKSAFYTEKRKFPRLKEHIFISYQLGSSPLKEFKAVTQDIGGGGLMFECERRVIVQETLGLEIYQSSSQCQKMVFVIPALAKAIWIQRINQDSSEGVENKYRVGVKFIRIKDEDRKIITEYVLGR